MGSCAQLVLATFGYRRKKVTRRMHALSATLLMTFCTCMAVHVADVASVLGLVGGFLASSLMYWFPALIFSLLLWPAQPRLFRLPVLLALIVFGACCWGSAILDLIR